IYGEKGGLEWHQMEPNTLIYKDQDSKRILRTGKGDLHPRAQAHTRIPAGHPEGYLEAFASIYRNFARSLRAKLAGEEPGEYDMDFPMVDDGVRGMAFVETVVQSSASDQKWFPMIDH
ncbi:MAG: gfo/Idh/MocA family oxidoreductase, partial [Bacteroidota bacterium]